MRTALLAAAALATAANARPDRPPIDWSLRTRSTVSDASTLSGQSFDYVIVGGGTAGLVIASRLTENSSVTVAVIEAGTTGAEVEDKLLAPAMAYFGGVANQDSEYDWQYTTEAQSNLNGRSIFWPREEEA
ncbi:hypothetical protein JCM6882_002823 [Rhodosporidiobolus microsporus]